MSKKNDNIEITSPENGVQRPFHKKEDTSVDRNIDQSVEKHLTVNKEEIDARPKELSSYRRVAYDINESNPRLPSAQERFFSNRPKRTSELEVLSLEKYDHRKMSEEDLVYPRKSQQNKIEQTNPVIEVIHIGGQSKELLPAENKSKVAEIIPTYSSEFGPSVESCSRGITVLPAVQQESTRLAGNLPVIAPRSLHRAGDPSSQSEEDTTSSSPDMSKSSEDLRAKQIYYKMKKEQSTSPDSGKSKKISDEDVSQASFWSVPKHCDNQPFLNMQPILNTCIDQDGKFGYAKGSGPIIYEEKSNFSWMYIIILILLMSIAVVVVILSVTNLVKEQQIKKNLSSDIKSE